MKLQTQSYFQQREIWPLSGRHILAQFDDDTIVVYQAYNSAIGHFAARNGTFGGDFKTSRMSWIKPNFLWMMYRSGWGTKPDQEVTLAVRLRRSFWEEILQQAVPSSFNNQDFASHEEWAKAVERSSVRLQWDPDHDPHGSKLERRAIQLGLRGETLHRYSRDEIVEIEDISSWVENQRILVQKRQLDKLELPHERIYSPSAGLSTKFLQLDSASSTPSLKD